MRGWNAPNLFRAGAGILFVCTIILGITELRSALRTSQTADLSLSALRTFDAAFTAFTAIGAERQPAEAALASSTGPALKDVLDILVARQATDHAIAMFRQRAKVDGLQASLNFPFLEAKLRSERQRVDHLRALPKAERKVGEQASAIRGMISASETAEPLLAVAAKNVIAADADLAGQVNMARLLGALHEAALRLPSEVLMSSSAGEVLPPEIVAAAQRVEQRILALWDVGASQLEFGKEKSQLASKLGQIRALYFGKGFPYLTRMIERQAQRSIAGFNPKQIKTIYEPSTKPIAELRDLYVETMVRQAKERQHSGVLKMLVTLVLALSIIGALPVLAWIAFRQVLRPLLEFRTQILAICSHGKREGRPYTGTVPQVQNLYRALETLWDREHERERLDRERQALSDRLKMLSETDQLTGLLNRRGLDARLSLLDEGHGQVFGFMLIDLDHFKTINDTFGHGVGDRVLQRLGALLAASVTHGACATRYGGEEFAIALAAASVADVLRLAEELRVSIEDSVIENAPHSAIRLTASFGVACCEARDGDWTNLVAQADAALYLAKAAGRNRVRATNSILARLTPIAAGPHELVAVAAAAE